MAHRTKKAIAAATRDLLKEKPLNKITVKEITDRCELTRNSFYYHFSDIYDVVNFIFEDEVDNLVSRYVDTQEWEAGFRSGIYFLYENKEMVDHIYRTLQHENIDRYLGNIIDRVVFRLVEHMEVPENVSDESRRIAVIIYRSAFAGVIQQWIIDDMAASPDAMALLCDEIFRATVLPILTSTQEALDSMGIEKLLR